MISMNDKQDVEFDIAVTVSDEVSGKANAGIKVLSVGIGGEGAKAAKESTVSRVKFTVPIIPPVQLVKPSSGSNGDT